MTQSIVACCKNGLVNIRRLLFAKLVSHLASVLNISIEYDCAHALTAPFSLIAMTNAGNRVATIEKNHLFRTATTGDDPDDLPCASWSPTALA